MKEKLEVGGRREGIEGGEKVGRGIPGRENIKSKTPRSKNWSSILMKQGVRIFGSIEGR